MDENNGIDFLQEENIPVVDTLRDSGVLVNDHFKIYFS